MPPDARSVPREIFEELSEELRLFVRHGNRLPSRYLVRCVQAKQLLDDPFVEIELDDIIQKHCDDGRVLTSTDLLVRAGRCE